MINFSYFEKIWKTIKIIYDSINELGIRMSDHKVFVLAGGLAYNILLYIIPLVLILVSFINIFVDPDELIHSIQQFINHYLPDSHNYNEIISNIIVEIKILSTSSKIAGIVGFIILL